MLRRFYSADDILTKEEEKKLKSLIFDKVSKAYGSLDIEDLYPISGNEATVPVTHNAVPDFVEASNGGFEAKGLLELMSAEGITFKNTTITAIISKLIDSSYSIGALDFSNEFKNDHEGFDDINNSNYKVVESLAEDLDFIEELNAAVDHIMTGKEGSVQFELGAFYYLAKNAKEKNKLYVYSAINDGAASFYPNDSKVLYDEEFEFTSLKEAQQVLDKGLAKAVKNLE